MKTINVCCLGKVRKHISKCRLLKFLRSMLKVKSLATKIRMVMVYRKTGRRLSCAHKTVIWLHHRRNVTDSEDDRLYLNISAPYESQLSNGAKRRDFEPIYEVITKTCLYNFDPLKPHFYIVKLGFTGVYVIFLISAQKHRLWVLVRTASARSEFLSENFQFFGGEIFDIFE